MNQNPNIVDVKSVMRKHPKTAHKLSKGAKVDSNSSLYSDMKKSEKKI